MHDSFFPAGGQSGWTDRDGNPVIASHLWTGRPPWAGSPADMLGRFLRVALYPAYSCRGCIGQHPQHGCYCLAMGAVAPGVPAGALVTGLRWLSERVLGEGE